MGACREALQAFLAVLNVKYAPMFECPICKDMPHLLLFDGKEMGHLKNRSMPYTPPCCSLTTKERWWVAADGSGPVST